MVVRVDIARPAGCCPLPEYCFYSLGYGRNCR